MIERRPFRSHEALLAAARTEWFALSPADWLEAFAQHPKIGDREALHQRFANTHQLAAREQSGVAAAPDDVLSALARRNREYEARFGYIFIVCATGKTGREMLRILEDRLGNDPVREIRIAATEQARITEIRLLGLR
jgi:2-oxo-4-hydroxy-4-carboxy-5-ureidoimidazoline decarboxylase